MVGHREGGERRLAGRVEAVDGLQQAERGDLDEVVELLAAALVAARQLARERQEARDERLAGRRVALPVVALEQAPVLLRARDPVLCGRVCCAARAAAVRLVVVPLLQAHHADPIRLTRRKAGARESARRVAGPSRRRV